MGSNIKSTVNLTFLSIISILLNFATQLIIAYYFGTSYQRDAYFCASIIPTYLMSVFSGSVNVIFLPIYINLLKNEGEKSANTFFSSVFLWGLIISSILATIIIVNATKVIELTTPGIDNEEQIYLISRLLRVLLLSVPLQMLIGLLTSVLQIRNKFVLSALYPIFVSIITLLFVILLCNKIGIESLAIGNVCGCILSLIFLVCLCKQNFIKVRFKSFLSSNSLSLLLKGSMPLVLVGVIFRLNGVIERGIASSLPIGSISYLGYATQLLTILSTIASNGISTVLFPKLSEAWCTHKLEDLRLNLMNGIRVVLLITVPISIVILFFGLSFIVLIFQRGAFDEVSSINVHNVLSILCIAFIAQSLGNLICKVLYMANKSKLFSLINMFELLIFIGVSLVGVKLISFYGIALGISISAFISFLLSLYFVSKIVQMRLCIVVTDFLRILLSSFIAISPLLMFAFDSNIYNVLLVVFLYPLLYFTIGYLLDIKEFKILKKMIYGKDY